MTRFTLNLREAPSGLPLFQRIAESLSREIVRGRLSPGAKLPSSRELATSLAVHRNTVLAAFAELERQDLIRTEPARGTFVSLDLPQRKGPAQSSERTKVPLDLPEPARLHLFQSIPKGTLALLGGLPELRTFPTKSYARALRHALHDYPQGLDYQSEYGDPRLSRALREHLRATRGVRATEEEVLVTRGSQLGLYLLARAVLRPGDTVLVEEYGYLPAWEAFRSAGARLVHVPVDRHGLSTESIGAICARQRIQAVYVTPHHQYPTTVSLSPARRRELTSLAQKHRFLIIEDDYDHEFHFEGRPILPMASADEGQVVALVGTFSKVLAPGLRAGYVVARSEIVERVARLRTFVDRQGDHIMERALAYLLEDGEIEAHVRRMHRTYRPRRELFLDILQRKLGRKLSFRRPDGGLAVWAELRQPHSAEDWARRALGEGLLIHPGRRFHLFGKNIRALRLGFARLDETELVRAIDLLKKTSP